MRNHRPASSDLVATVSDFLADIGEKLEPGDRYQALICRHLLAMVRRELEGAVLADIDEARLAAEIRAGARDESWDATFAEILERTIARVVIARPEHLAARHAGASR